MRRRAWMRRRARRGREAGSRSFRHVKGRKTRRNETLPNAVFSPGENVQPPQRTAQLCPLSSLIHRVISSPLRSVFFFPLYAQPFSRGFRFRVINDESRDRRRNKKKRREREGWKVVESDEEVEARCGSGVNCQLVGRCCDVRFRSLTGVKRFRCIYRRIDTV